MIPPEILAIIQKRGDKFTPNTTHPLYEQYKDTWRLYLDLKELDEKKLRELIVPHGTDEKPEMLELRQKLAAVFNYVPTVISITVNYLFSEQPVIESNDPALKSFIEDCDGSGTTLEEYIRFEALPLALAFGMVDTLVQNPATPAGLFVTAADIDTAEIKPRVHTITPLQRINWSTKPNHAYNWVCFTDTLGDDTDPFNRNAVMPVEYVTIAQGTKLGEEIINEPGSDVHRGFWIRSSHPIGDDGKERGDIWEHDGGWLCSDSVPIETLYYNRSLDSDRKHFGISKIAQIATLTKKIIQILSWTDEDVLANLALFVFPGDPPKDDKGAAIDQKIQPFSILYLGRGVEVPPSVVQGATSHMEFKLKLIDACIREILRLAFLIGASAEAEQITSGVQGVVSRNELFMELRNTASGLDKYGIGLLARAKSWLEDKPVSVKELPPGTRVDFYKGNYAIEPLATIIENTTKLREAFRMVSPTMVKEAYQQLAQAVLYNENEKRHVVYTEIDTFFTAEQTQLAAQTAEIAGAPAEEDTNGAEVIEDDVAGNAGENV